MDHAIRMSAGDLQLPRREALKTCIGAITVAAASASRSLMTSAADGSSSDVEVRPWITTRGIYGGYLSQILEQGGTPADFGINAIWTGSGNLDEEEIRRYHQLGLKVYAEFNSMHHAAFLKDHPDAAPVGPDGQTSPAPDGWQGVSPFHAGYRTNRMQEFRRVLTEYSIDGIWLDYHHSHASWEQAVPKLPDTDFSPAALQLFTQQTGIQLPDDISQASALLLNRHRDAWTDFRCEVFTDWVREYREILNQVRPSALLGTFHCPWSPSDLDGAIRHKLAIDLKAQAQYLDVFSIMPYHARFGHADDLEWIARQTRMLGELLGIQGTSEETKKIWPILQGSDWGETVRADQLATIIECGTRQPATGVMVFHWSALSKQWDKVEAIGNAYRALSDNRTLDGYRGEQ